MTQADKLHYGRILNYLMTSPDIHSLFLLQIKEQCLCTIWNFSVDEKLRYKLLGSDMLIPIVRFLDDEDIKVKEVAASITSYLTLSHSYHGALVEAGVIPKLVSCGSILFLLNNQLMSTHACITLICARTLSHSYHGCSAHKFITLRISL